MADKTGAGAPTLGRIVHYRSKFGEGDDAYQMPALVICTEDSWTPNDTVPKPVKGTVHLSVFSSGPTVLFQEFSVAEGDGPGQWSWPPKV
jgi:hypothetical protein